MESVRDYASQLEWQCPDCVADLSRMRREKLGCHDCGRSLRRVDGVWRVDPGFLPSGFGAPRVEHLHVTERRHFWFPARRALVKRKIVALLGGNDAAVLEMGCGSGGLLSELDKQARLRVGVEGHIASLVGTTVSSKDVVLIHGDVAQVPLSDGQFDLVVALDVLEHLEPIPMLREAHRLTRPGGYLLLSVPAMASLWSAVDEAAGHRCRYDLSMLVRELEAAEWKLIDHTHYQFLLLPLVLASRWRYRKTHPELERSPPRWMNAIFRWINLLEVGLFGDRRLPFGSSLIAWAEKSR